MLNDALSTWPSRKAANASPVMIAQVGSGAGIPRSFGAAESKGSAAADGPSRLRVVLILELNTDLDGVFAGNPSKVVIELVPVIDVGSISCTTVSRS